MFCSFTTWSGGFYVLFVFNTCGCLLWVYGFIDAIGLLLGGIVCAFALVCMNDCFVLLLADWSVGIVALVVCGFCGFGFGG